MDIQSLLTSDQQLLLAMNGSDSLFLDQLALILTSAWTWVPLYASLLYLVVKNNEKAGQIILAVISALLCVGIVTGIDNGLVKPEVARLRPSFEPALEGLVRTVDGYRGSGYSFFSAHASNTFSLAVFFSLLIRRRTVTVALLTWALVNSWTRIYLGVHYPFDVLVGILFGSLVGLTVYPHQSETPLHLHAIHPHGLQSLRHRRIPDRHGLHLHLCIAAHVCHDNGIGTWTTR